MALQTGMLHMVGLGIKGNEPHDPDQPPLTQGIHLRWAFPREAGFPWHGFYLYRRKQIQEKLFCIMSLMTKAGQFPSPLSTANGDLTSDQPIVLGDDFAPPGSLEARLDGRKFLRLTFRPSPIHRAIVQVGFYKPGTVEITVFAGSQVLAKLKMTGASGTIEKSTLNFDAITAIEFGAGPAALVDLCFAPVVSDRAHWEPVPGFVAPMRLPVTSPAYPLTPGSLENLAAARKLARDRIRYGNPDQFTGAPLPQTAGGVVTLIPNSPVVRGMGTAWDASLIGGLLHLPAGTTAWTVAAVVSPTLLVLNRAYSGPPLNLSAYSIDRDSFGELHDHLVHLVEGGPLAGPMVSRSLPAPVPTSGTALPTHDSRGVNGVGSAWGPVLEGLSLRFGRPAVGTVALSQGSRYVAGTLTAFNASHAGLRLRVGFDPTPYTIERVFSPTLLELSRPYEGTTVATAGYSLTERELYTIQQVISPTRLQLDRNYRGPSGASRPYSILATLHSETGPGAVMPSQNPLDLALLGSLHPAVAQMLGVYWVDASADASQIYDYLVVADATGVGTGDPLALLAHLQSTGFADADGFIAYGLQVGVAPALATPSNLRTQALPGGPFAGEDGAIIDAVGSVGLVWDLGAGSDGQLQPGAPVWYHLWRGAAGVTDVPDTLPLTKYVRITAQPVVVAKPKSNPLANPRPAGDWPPFPLYTIDRGLPEGWYSYLICGVDLFGRFSPRSDPAPWYEWAPPPTPRPWYYLDPPGSRVVHPFAVRLLDQLAPPPPVAIEGYSLDPRDPTVVQDAAAVAWRNSLPSAERETTVGLRVRWQWPRALQRQAPDLREFRIYLAPGALNSLEVHTALVTAASATESDVGLDRPAPDGAYVGAALYADGQSFSIVASTGAQIRVRNLGPLKDVVPPAHASARILVPEVLAQGSVTLTHGGIGVVGLGTLFTTALVGQRIGLEGDEGGNYTVAMVSSQTLLTLDRAFAGPSGAGRHAGITHPLFIDYSVATAWRERCQVVPYEENWLPLPDGGRQYEIFRRAPADFLPTREDPISRLQIGVSGADNRTHTQDQPQWGSGGLGGRFGNEGRVGSPATAFRVLRDPPPPADPLPGAERVFASRADYHGRSFYTFRWRPLPSLQLHLFRAVDESIFLADMGQRPRPPLDPVADLALFPPELRPRAAELATALNALNQAPFAVARYRALSDAALRVLAGLPGNDRVYAQLTVEALDAEAQDPTSPGLLRWRDRGGPDTAEDYLPDASLRAYVDTLDGKGTNRYFYRAAWEDGAHNRGPLGLAAPPVWLPKTSPPRTPSVTKILGGDRQIQVRWSSNREVDVIEYRVYRAPDIASAADLRTMTLVHQETVAPGDPALRPPEVDFTDTTVAPLSTYYYRLVAVDDAGNASTASRAWAGRAFDASRPSPPLWAPATPVDRTLSLAWTAGDPALRCLVQRSFPGANDWESLSGWLPRGVYAYQDTSRIPAQHYAYRLRVLDAQGRTNAEYRELLA